jgi:MFS family permease
MQTIESVPAHRKHVLGAAMMRRLLQTDKEVLPVTDVEFDEQVERHYSWNFRVNLVDVAFFWLGLSFASTTTVIPLFVSKLSPNPLLIGLVAVLGQAGWFLPQLLTAGWIERSARKKPWVINVGFFSERLPLFLWPAAAMLALVSPPAALVLFFITFAHHHIGAGLIAPAWQDMIASCFPVNRRGRFLGISFFVGTGVGTIGALFSGQILEWYAFPYNFALLFALAAVAILISWFFVAQTREPVRPVDEAAMADVNLRRKLGRILREDVSFRRYLLTRMLISIGAMGTGFVAVSAVSRFGVADQVIGYYTAMMLIGQTVGNLISGLVADRYGHKPSLILSTVALVASFGMAWLAPSAIWYYGVFLLLGFHTAGAMVSGLLIVMEFTDRSRRPTYVGVANTAVGIANLAAPLLGGWLALSGYDLLFAISAGIGLISLVLLIVVVTDPRNQKMNPSPQESESMEDATLA